MEDRIRTDQQEPRDTPTPRDGAIPCITWALAVEPTLLPSIPVLPKLNNETSAEQKPTQLIQVAGLDNHLIGLTNEGHVLIFGSLDNETTAPRGTWQYVRTPSAPTPTDEVIDTGPAARVQ
jgi:SCF-associated factor 1